MKWYRTTESLKRSAWSMAIGLACFAAVLLAGSFAAGAEIQDLGSLPVASKMETATRNLKVEIASGERIDVAPLLQCIGDNDSVEEAFQKIDRLRTKLYPKKELKLTIENLNAARESAGDGANSFIDLQYKVAWFNLSHASGRGWGAENIQSGAACCVAKVRQGAYKFYYENPNQSWKSGGTRSAQQVWAATTYGSDLMRGFKAVATGPGKSKSDVYMYFYFINRGVASSN